MEWDGILNLCNRNFKEPKLEFLRTLARDDETQILTFRLQGLSHRLTYEDLSRIMGTSYTYCICSHFDSYLDFLRNPDGYFWGQITRLDSFNLSRYKEIIL